MRFIALFLYQKTPRFSRFKSVLEVIGGTSGVDRPWGLEK